MEEIKKLGDEALEYVIGGAVRKVHNSAASYANVRKGPGLDYDMVYTIGNDQTVVTNGRHRYNDNDGYVWYQLTDDCWIAGSLIGY